MVTRIDTASLRREHRKQWSRAMFYRHMCHLALALGAALFVPGSGHAISEVEECVSRATDRPIAQQAAFCCTAFGRCSLSRPLALGERCYCSSDYGPVVGRACN